MRSSVRTTALVISAVVVAAVVLRAPVLTAAGSYLVREDGRSRADAVLVLGGDGFGRRILAGAELVKQGYAPKVYVSGPAGMYGKHECDLAIPFAVARGYQESYFVHSENNARSTREEAEAASQQLRRDGVKTVLLVTSDYHTRRAGRTFRKAAPDLTFKVAATPDEYFRADGWWRQREAQKIFLFEWEKTVAAWMGL